jgi:hypothetical protein
VAKLKSPSADRLHLTPVVRTGDAPNANRINLLQRQTEIGDAHNIEDFPPKVQSLRFRHVEKFPQRNVEFAMRRAN